MIFSLLFFAGVLGTFPAFGVPATPNESLVAGKVLDLISVDSSTLNMKPPQILFQIKLRLLSVQDVQNKPNFLKTKEGEILEVYSKEVLSSRLLGKVIKGLITFRGDERGGLYWILKVSETESF